MRIMKPNDSILAGAAAEPEEKGAVRICWETREDAEISVYAGLTPDEIDYGKPVAQSSNGCAKVSGLDPDIRYYFEIRTGTESLLTAERRVNMEGAVNFRDIGGYETADGRRVKWGKVFRADGLARLTDRDLNLLEQIGVRRVYDFRTESEVSSSPDRLPERGGVDHINLPVKHGNFDFSDAVKRLRNGDHDWLSQDFMVNGYIQNLEDFGQCWATVIEDLAMAGKEAVVFHCTGGKDRTGTCAALILLALGVFEETVIDDHQLSNIYIAEILPRIHKKMEKAGIDPDLLFPYFTAPRECIVAVIDYLFDNYGSAEEYLLRKGGIGPKIIDKLRQNLLE